MAQKMAVVIFDNCHPEKCPDGACAAVTACPHKLIKQEDPYDTPMFHPTTCQGCGDCVKACPQQAIKIVTV